MHEESGRRGNGLVLFGHGARDPEWAGPMRRTREAILAADASLPVELAFMEFMTPNLDEAVDALVERKLTHITVIPVFLAQGGHLKRDVPALVAAAQARHPACEIRLAVAAGESSLVIDAIAAYAMRCSGDDAR